jgi:hypothetical protein
MKLTIRQAQLCLRCRLCQTSPWGVCSDHVVPEVGRDKLEGIRFSWWRIDDGLENGGRMMQLWRFDHGPIVCGNPALSRDGMNGSALQRADAQVPLVPEQSNGMLGPPCAIWLHERLRVAMHDWAMRTFVAQESFLRWSNSRGFMTGPDGGGRCVDLEDNRRCGD